MSLMLETYHKDIDDLEEWCEAKYAGYAQNLDRIEERRVSFLVRAVMPLLGMKTVG